MLWHEEHLACGWDKLKVLDDAMGNPDESDLDSDSESDASMQEQGAARDNM